jgi:hypothetical protein
MVLAGCGADSSGASDDTIPAAPRTAALIADLDAFTEWSAPANIGPPINSEFAEGGGSISRDGLTFYFPSTRSGGCGAPGDNDIWVSTRSSVDEPWGTPVNLGCHINSAALDAAPILTLDEHRMYFHSRRPGGPGAPNDLDLYVIRRRDTRDPFGWGPPERLSINTDFSEAQPAFFEDDVTGIGTLFFVSDRLPSLGRADIWSSALQPDGTFGPPSPVEGLNSSFRDQAPFIRRDGLEIYFSSERDHPVAATDMSGLDLYVATRATTSDPWSTPVNLDYLAAPNTVINSPVIDDRPILSFDGTRLYFQSRRDDGLGANDIYVITRSKLRSPQ